MQDGGELQNPEKADLDNDISKIFGIIGVFLASINIFGGFIVTYRMLSMFKKKSKQKNKN